MKNYWHYRKSLVGRTHDSLASSRWDCPYIIRLGINGCAFVYDTRKYSNMTKVDFDYYGYTLISSHPSVDAAKRKVGRLMLTEERGAA